MHHIARRTAGFTTALAVAGLLVAGCGEDNNPTDAAGSVTSAVAPGEEGGENGEPGQQPPEGEEPGMGAGDTTVNTPGGEITIAGEIYQKYQEAGGENSPLGMPEAAEEQAPEGGKFQNFAGGTIYSSEETGSHIVWGDIREAWEENGGPTGPLGFPVADEEDTPEGKKSEFSGGTITWTEADRQTQVEEK